MTTYVVRNDRFTATMLYGQGGVLPSGTIVSQGQVIGTSGNMAAIYGGTMINHVHLQVMVNGTGKFTDPTGWIFP